MRMGLAAALVALAACDAQGPPPDDGFVWHPDTDSGLAAWPQHPDPPEPDPPTDPRDLDLDGDGLTPNAGDCDDTDPHVYMGAPEHCDGIDNDCDAEIDEDLGHALIQSSDYGADGVVESITGSAYNSSGQLTQTMRDTDGDGEWDQIDGIEYIFDTSGRLVAVETDYGLDGVVDTVRYYRYDRDGRLLRIERDDGVDGTYERIDTYFYDPETGFRIRWEGDEPVGGQPEYVNTYTHDDDGRLLEAHMQRFDAEGELTSEIFYQYRYDPSGRTEAIYVDYGPDPGVDSISSYTYDELGRIEVLSIDSNADGVPDSQTRYVYDEDGAISKIETDSGADDTIDTIVDRETVCWEPL